MNAKSLLYIGLPIVLLGALYVALKPQRTALPLPAPAQPPAIAVPQPAAPQPAAPQAVAPATQSAPAAAQVEAAPAAATATPLVFDVVIKNGKRASGPSVFKVKEGDEVTINVTADKGDRLHLHGYDLHADLLPGKTATLSFGAKLTGRFPLELHHSGLELGALEVFPR